MKKTENPDLIKAIRFLKRKARELNAPIWRDLAIKLEKSNQNRCAVNISRINRYIKDGETAAVPGKVLGAGSLNREILVAAFSFSGKAKSRIEAAGGKCLSFSTLIANNPKGAKIRIIG